MLEYRKIITTIYQTLFIITLLPVNFLQQILGNSEHVAECDNENCEIFGCFALISLEIQNI